MNPNATPHTPRRAELRVARLTLAMALAGLASADVLAADAAAPLRLSQDLAGSAPVRQKTAITSPGAVAKATAPVAQAARSSSALDHGRFVYRAEGKRLSDVLQDFAASQGVPAVVADGVEGMVNANFDARPRDFLEGIARAYNLLWYHDGTALYFYPGRAVQSRLFRLKGFRRDQVNGLLTSLRLGDKRYPIRFDEANSTLYISGPPRHVELINAALDALDAGVSESAERTVRVFELQFASAADRQMGDVLIPGVASTLRKLYTEEDAGAGRASADAIDQIKANVRKKQSAAVPMPRSSQFLPPLPRANAKDGSPTSEPNQSYSKGGGGDADDNPPRFEADEGNNAVIVQGRADRMAEYEALIRRLDQKPRLVELEATIIEVNSDSVDALGVNWSMRGSGGSVSLTSPAPATPGAANAFTLSTLVSDAGRELLARVNALQSEGKARVLSKPSVLGVANRAAVMREKRVASVRVAGEREANLFQVEAGTLLEMTPQVIDGDYGEIKLSLYIEDGAFETRQIDAVPVVKKTEIRTEAHVREGESLLIGGITVETEQVQDNSVPGLSKIPLLGGIFRSTERQVTRTERLFLITPRLVGANFRPATGTTTSTTPVVASSVPARNSTQSQVQAQELRRP
ncbi:type III secretion system outer membrane ring subunit SctC [Ideonella sp. YS5]|uniref:type III secretion system outer membrane ring subunit SctC n=1 Tax=Ideonella sp. YS5 TaxID=3453714 RepID=UPI003EEA5BEE